MLYKNAVDSSTLDLLIQLQHKEYLKDFFLVGGTALALKIGHRKSIDLDLFSTISFDTNHLLENLSADFPFKLFFSATNTLKGSINQIQVETKPTRVPRATKNNNLGSFVDAVTPEPKIVLENFINIDKLNEVTKKATPESKQWISQMVDIALSITKQEQFLSMGEIIAINSLRKQGILV